MPDTTLEVVTERRGRLGLIKLNRPSAINALTHAMIRAVADTLDQWRDDPLVTTVAIVGAGERGLCAGSDVVALYEDVTRQDGMNAAGFWREQYTLNATIASYPKPYVAIQDGIVLGGGLGVSAHGSHRIVTERSRLGFPETTIGFVPDVGATWLLSRAPGKMGARLALSSEHIAAADAILVGLSDWFVPSDQIDKLLAAMETTDADSAINAVAQEPPLGVLVGQRTWTDAVFAAVDVGQILAALRASGVPEAVSLADRIEQKSPIALSVALEAIRRGHSLLSLESALVQEYRVSRQSSKSHDFAEGIRAQLVDKDRTPLWMPSTLADTTAEEIQLFFSEPADGDLAFHHTTS